MGLAKQDVIDVGNETALLLASDEPHSHRQKRALPTVATARDGIGVFGSGVLMGNQCSEITGIFGSCQENGRRNAENLNKLSQHSSALTDFVMEATHEDQEKFLLVYNVLKSLLKIQQDTEANHNQNWQAVKNNLKFSVTTFILFTIAHN